MTQLPKIEYLRKYFVHKFQDGKGRNRVHSHFEILDKMFSLNFILGYQVIKITTIKVYLILVLLCMIIVECTI